MNLIMKHSNWSKIIVLFSFSLFLMYFLFVNWNLISLYSIFLSEVSLSFLDLLHLLFSNFFSGSIILKIIFLVLLFSLFNSVLLEIISSFLDYIHSNLYWSFFTYWVICLYYSFYISIFYYIFLL